MKGKDAGSLEEGDVICLTANVAGTRINHMYLLQTAGRRYNYKAVKISALTFGKVNY